jgi:formamidopyrimidine-DNA glycosylase
MMIHLRMSGQVLIDRVDSPRPAHSHVVLTLRDISGSIQELRFVDPRTFGEVVVFDPADADSIVPELARLGLDPITDGLSLAQLRKILRTTARPIKAALLDQHLVAGIGNIYGDEILHQARVNPLRPARDVGPAQSVRVHRAIHEILEAAIGQDVDLEGGSGSFQNQHRVYGRAGEPCLTCHRGKIFSTNIGGRTSCWCRVCQR